jgi:hypothetical protein
MLHAQIGRIIGEAESTLYERQRALVRDQVLMADPGHGRGSGVRATPESLAALLISIMGTPIWSESAAVTRRLMDADTRTPSIGETPPCELTEVTTFGPALTAILAKSDLAKRVVEIGVSKHSATIKFDRVWIIPGATETDWTWKWRDRAGSAQEPPPQTPFTQFQAHPNFGEMFKEVPRFLAGEKVWQGIQRTATLDGDALVALSKLVAP